MATVDDAQRTRRTGRWRRVVTITTVVVALAAVGGTGWLWRHPRAFVGELGFSAGANEWHTGEPFYVVLAFGGRRDGSVTLRSLSAAGVSGPRTDIDFVICTTKVGATLPAGVIDREGLDDTCGKLTAAEGRRYRLDESQLLLMRMTPALPGDLAVDGANITYSYRWQRGRQHIGFPFTGHIIT